MTSRPILAVQQRQPQRPAGLGGGGASVGGSSGLSQRPSAAAAARSLSHQKLPPSPIRKEASFTDLSPVESSSDVAQGAPSGSASRYATNAPRRGGSRLKLELSHDAGDDTIMQSLYAESPQILDPSKTFTPSRVMVPTEPSELGDMSPHPQVKGNPFDNDGPLPMPQRRQRFAPPPSRRPQPPLPPPRRDNRPKPYSIEVPLDAPCYPILGKGGSQASRSSTSSLTSGIGGVRQTNKQLGHADFFPWTGKHQEDQFSETVIRQGCFDKVSVTSTETTSAKGALYSALKHKSGLQALSTVFTGIMGQRRFAGQITAPSTFKPPPRVTLTDTKKEMWLRDLANPAIPLRRLSRTIPHGIRGKALLDQCLNKSVPLDRAAWLAKCVGANEIRAFKRKTVSSGSAMGGETKFIRDWTIFVEQFVESVISCFGNADWKVKVNYAVRLATHLYSEYLLDREHYMDWVVSNFENSGTAKLPMWMLVAQIYWKDLLQLRKFGKRLVSALARHHHEIQTHPDKDILQSLGTRLASMLNFLLLNSPQNFINPSDWFAYRDTIRTIIPAGDLPRQNAFDRLNSRNEQATAANTRSQPAARHIVIKMLDTTFQIPMSDELPKEVWNISKDKAALGHTLLQWCTSMHRPALAKVFVTSRIIKYWGTLGTDVTSTILEFLDFERLEELGRKTPLYQLIGELVRSGHFSVSRYVQWLIARGGIAGEQNILPEGSAATRLLVELPVHCLGRSQRSMRAGMLRRACFSADDEEQDIEMAKRYLRRALGLPPDPYDHMHLDKPLSVGKLAKRIGKSSLALRTTVSAWLREQFKQETDQMLKDGRILPHIPSTTFNLVRTILEAAEDFSILAEILGTVAGTSNIEVLASCADTVNRHLLIFTALGAGKELFDKLHGRLRVLLDEQGILVRPLFASLVGLAPRIPGWEALAARLTKELAYMDRNSPVDACSPVSDNMALLQDEDTDVQEEIEKLLNSGTSLDRNTMDRLYQTVIQRFQGCWDQIGDKQRRYGLLLTRLRMFDAQHFDTLMSKWLVYVRSMRNRPSVSQIYPLLVSLGCLSMSTILATTSTEASGGGVAAGRPMAGGPPIVHLTYRTRYLQEVLRLLMAPIGSEGLLPEECYRFVILQEQAQTDHVKEVLTLVRNALSEWAFIRTQGEMGNLPLDDPKTWECLQSLVRLLMLKDANGVAKALALKSSDEQVRTRIDRLTTGLIMPSPAPDVRITFDQILELTDELTLPFCQVKLFLILAPSPTSADQPNVEATERQQSLVELFANAMDKVIEARDITWTGMLSYFNSDITHQLKIRAQSRFLDLFPLRTTYWSTQEINHFPVLLRSFGSDWVAISTYLGTKTPLMVQHFFMEKQGELRYRDWNYLVAEADAERARGKQQAVPTMPPRAFKKQQQSEPPARPAASTDIDLPSEQKYHVAENLLAVIEAIIRGGTMGRPPQMIPTMIDRLQDLWGLLANPEASDSHSSVLDRWLPLMLNFIILNIQSFDAVASVGGSKPGPEARSRVLIICSGLLQELDTLGGPGVDRETCLSLSQRILDLASLLADNLPDENRLACIRTGKDVMYDRRIRYLFSYQPPPDENFMLSRRDKQPTATGAGGLPAPGTRGGPSIPGASLLGTPVHVWGVDARPQPEKLVPFQIRRWEMLSEPTPIVGENDTALSLTLFEARKKRGI